MPNLEIVQEAKTKTNGGHMFVTSLTEAIRHLESAGDEIHLYPVTPDVAQEWVEQPEDGEPVCATYEGALAELASLGINTQNMGVVPRLAKATTFILGIDHREYDQIYLFGVSAE